MLPLESQGASPLKGSGGGAHRGAHLKGTIHPMSPLCTRRGTLKIFVWVNEYVDACELLRSATYHRGLRPGLPLTGWSSPARDLFQACKGAGTKLSSLFVLEKTLKGTLYRSSTLFTFTSYSRTEDCDGGVDFPLPLTHRGWGGSGTIKARRTNVRTPGPHLYDPEPCM